LNPSVQQPSGYAVSNYKITENYDFIATYKKDITEDLNVSALVGTNINYQSTYSTQLSTSGGLKSQMSLQFQIQHLLQFLQLL
jgi:hypothetical protein